MKCTIPGSNVKVLARAVHALSRIGDELYVEPNIDSISFRSVNASRSAYASFTFRRPFFTFYKYEGSQIHTPSQEESAKCKISMKSCIPVFKSPVMLDRKVENCVMWQEEDCSKLVFEMRCRHGIIKTHILPIIECETLQVIYTKENTSNCLLAPVQLFMDAVHNFHNTQEEVTLAVTPQKTFLRSYIDAHLNPAKTKHTELYLEAGEFDNYSVSNETAVTFCLKEFRALLAFAEATVLPVEACFDTCGRPIVFAVKNENSYEASFVLSTLSPELESQASVENAKESSHSSHRDSGAVNKSSSKERQSVQLPTRQEVNRVPSQTSSYTSSPSLLQFAGNSQPKRISDSKDAGNHTLQTNNAQENSALLNGSRSLTLSHDCTVSLNVRESDDDNDEDTVAPSPQPPVKKLCRMSDLFETTFDPNSIPGHNIILAEDSGGEDGPAS